MLVKTHTICDLKPDNRSNRKNIEFSSEWMTVIAWGGEQIK